MKIRVLLLPWLLAACSMPSGNSPPTDTAPGTAVTASASGSVEAVDANAKTVTISHGPVDSLKWPAMKMTFQAPQVDLASIKPGDEVDFQFTSKGMDGTISKISVHK